MRASLKGADAEKAPVLRRRQVTLAEIPVAASEAAMAFFYAQQCKLALKHNSEEWSSNLWGNPWRAIREFFGRRNSTLIGNGDTILREVSL